MIDPVLVSIGPVQIRYYGLVYVLGFLLVYYFLKKNQKKTGLNPEQTDNLMIFLVFGMMISARIFHFLFSDISIFWTDPLELFRIWHGGMSFFGALVGSVSATYLYLRNKKAEIWNIFDIVVIPAAFTLILGRIANFINQELVGTITDAPWCVNFTGYLGCRHPYQIYAAISHLLLFAALLLFMRYKEKEGLAKGTVFAVFLIGYGFFRFITDFFREDPRFLVFTVWQAMSFIIVIVGIWLFKFRQTRT